jgi:hypothetical protein
VNTFHRPDLAREYAESLLGVRRFGATSGLFLANRRRTGKSTFLLADLIPALENLGAVAIYVDLWADQQAEPGALIAKAIAGAIRRHEGLGAKAVRAGLRKITVLGVAVEVSSPQLPEQATLTDLLAELHRAARTKIVLIIDEAQQATAPGKGGMEAMAALKSARDQLNLGGDYTLAIVMTGSDRAYTDSLAALIEEDRPDIQVDRNVLEEAFVMLGYRPQLLGQIIRDLTGLGRPPAERFNEEVEARATAQRLEREAHYANTYTGLKHAPRAVLSRILGGRGQGMFTPDAKAEYRHIAGTLLTDNQIQNALEKMRTSDSPLIWKSDRGDYALEDTQMRDWYVARAAAGKWPPAA